MIINVRYYLLTVISIFISLGIGIFIGFLFDAQNVLSSQKNYMIDDLEKKFVELKIENETFSNEIDELIKEKDKDKEKLKKLTLNLITDSMVDNNILILKNNDNIDYQLFMDILNKTGANINYSYIKDLDLNTATNIEDLSNINESMVLNNKIQDFKNKFLNQVDCIIVNDTTGYNNDNIIIMKKLKNLNIPLIIIQKKMDDYLFIDYNEGHNISTFNDTDSVFDIIDLIVYIKLKIIQKKKQEKYYHLANGVIKMDNKKIKIVALIPAYNEEDKITSTINNIKKIKIFDEIIVIDDGSIDNTYKNAKKTGVKIIKLNKNHGKGYAIKVGIKNIQYDILALIDADLGKTSKEITKLLDVITKNQCDIAVAKFPKTNKKAGFGFVKRLAKFSVYLLSKHKINTALSGQRVYKRNVIESIEWIPKNFGIEVAMTIQALNNGYKYQEIDVNMEHRYTKRNIRGFIHRGKQFVDILKCVLVLSIKR